MANAFDKYALSTWPLLILFVLFVYLTYRAKKAESQ